MEELPVRYIRSDSVRTVTPHMVRVTFTVDRLTDLVDGSPDQQVKLYFPKPGQDVPRLPEPDSDLMNWYQAYTAIPDDERPWMRSFTIRGHDHAHGTIDVDFVLHGDDAPASRWAQHAQPGDVLGMFGPSQYFARPVSLAASIAAADWLLLAGDETALPAMSTVLEALPAGHPAVAYIEVADSVEEQQIDSPGAVAIHWLHRDGAAAGTTGQLLDAVRTAEFRAGQVFAWIAGESSAVRALRRHLVDDRDVEKRSIDFAGYWRLTLTQDDAPTDEDMAEAQERLAEAQATEQGS